MKSTLSRSISTLCIVALVLCVCVIPSNGVARAAPAANAQVAPVSALGLSDPVEMGAFIDGIMADQIATNHIPGAVIAVAKDGKMFYEKGYGYSNYESRTPVDAEQTIFRVGSVSKVFVWTAVMQLVEQGKLSLDADVNTYLDFKIPATFPQPITMMNLLSHTAGFEDRGYGNYKLKPEELISLEQYVKTRLPARVYTPGTVTAYSNYGASLAGYIVERITGMPFFEYTEKYIFSPLGMAHSSFRQPLPPELVSSLANGYNFYDGEFKKSGFEYVLFYPAGGLSSTAADMVQFMLAHLGNGQLGASRILSDKTAQQMHRQLFTSDPRLPGMAYGFIENRINGQRLIYHSGDTTFFNSGLYLIPDQQLGIFVATNAPGGNQTRSMLIQKFMDRYLPAPAEAPETPADDFASRVAPFLGTYYASRRAFTRPEKIMSTLADSGTISLDGEDQLTASLSGRTFHLVEIEPGLFEDREDANIKMALHTDERGQAYLYMAGPNFAYLKVPWYWGSSFVNLLIIFGLLVFVYTLTTWAGMAYTWLRKRKSAPEAPANATLPRLARWTAALFCLLGSLLIICLQVGLGSVDPNLGVPIYDFNPPPLFFLLPPLTYLVTGVGVIVLAFTPLVWVRRMWNLTWRLHYCLVAVAGLAMVWLFWFWNLNVLLG